MTNQYISPFIPSQFPLMFQEEGPLFIDFMQAYYEWLETESELKETRSFIDYNDIDKTSDDFLIHFQEKYLVNIPTELITDKRLIIKHIYDLYRAKGSVKGWKLLFRILFNQDVEVYFPNEDIFTPSEALWHEPKYIEVYSHIDLTNYIGKRIIGASSGVSAVVENITQEPINGNIITIMFLSHILPLNSQFNIGEKLKLSGYTGDLKDNPTILGSLNGISITTGGQNFEVGNVLKVVNEEDSQIITRGTGGEFRVTATSRGIGSIYYDLNNGGGGYSDTAKIIQYNGNTDTTGIGASFNIGSLIDVQYHTFNDDLIVNYIDVPLNSNTFGFPLNPSGNISTPLVDLLNFETNQYGSIHTLNNIVTGNNYTSDLNIKIHESIDSRPLPGNISYNSSNNVIAGNGTLFTTYFQVDDVLGISNTSNSAIEYHVISAIANNTSLTLKGKPHSNSSNGSYRISISPFIAEYGLENARSINGSVLGDNAIVTGIPSTGQGVVSNLISIDSGKGYIQGEELKLYLYKPINQPEIVSGGTGYSNGDVLIFSGGSTSPASGSVVTDNDGVIVSILMTSFGSVYSSEPTIIVRSRTGSGANITASIGEYNNYTVVKGKADLSSIGKSYGRWLNSKSFLNYDKVLQDSDFYQTYSYQLLSSIDFNKYKNVLKTIYHVAGHKMFTGYQNQEVINNLMQIVNEYFIVQEETLLVTNLEELILTEDEKAITKQPELFEG